MLTPRINPFEQARCGGIKALTGTDANVEQASRSTRHSLSEDRHKIPPLPKGLTSVIFLKWAVAALKSFWMELGLFRRMKPPLEGTRATGMLVTPPLVNSSNGSSWVGRDADQGDVPRPGELPFISSEVTASPARTKHREKGKGEIQA